MGLWVWPVYRSTLISRSRTAEAHPHPYLCRDRENVDYVHIQVFLNEPVQWTDRWEETGRRAFSLFCSTLIRLGHLQRQLLQYILTFYERDNSVGSFGHTQALKQADTLFYDESEQGSLVRLLPSSTWAVQSVNRSVCSVTMKKEYSCIYVKQCSGHWNLMIKSNSNHSLEDAKDFLHVLWLQTFR